MDNCLCAVDGAGLLYLEDISTGAPAGYFSYQNGSDIRVESVVTRTLKANLRTAFGGACEAKQRVDNVRLAGTLYAFCQLNMQAALFGVTKITAAGVVAALPLVLHPGAYLPLTPFPDVNVVPVLEPAGGGAPYSFGTDYQFAYAGILSSAVGAIPTPVDNVTPNVQLTYTGLATDSVHAFVKTDRAYRGVFDGIGRNNNEPYRLRIHQLVFDADMTLPANGGGFMQYPLGATVLFDHAFADAEADNSGFFIRDQVAA